MTQGILFLDGLGLSIRVWSALSRSTSEEIVAASSWSELQMRQMFKMGLDLDFDRYSPCCLLWRDINNPEHCSPTCPLYSKVGPCFEDNGYSDKARREFCSVQWHQLQDTKQLRATAAHLGLFRRHCREIVKIFRTDLTAEQQEKLRGLNMLSYFV